MDKATVYKCVETVHKIESFSDQIPKASQLMTFGKFDISYGGAYKVVKQDLKKRQIFEQHLLQKCPWKRYNLVR